ncbi:MAG TPA: ATP-binding protein, partial [Bacteroidia bacterium]|nr:ATP-binding protein [Bacteroidia bacterium]
DNELVIIKRAPFFSAMMNGEIMLAFSTAEIIQSKKEIRATALVVSAIVLFIGILIGFWLAKNISVPVLELRDAALRVGEGDLTQQVKKHANDEIGELSEAFNKMVKDLAKAEEKVKSAQDQLVHAEKMASLGQLTAGIAHEIQNPLNFVNNFSRVSVELLDELKQAHPGDQTGIMDDLKTNLDKINHHGGRAEKIVKSMLLHSRSGNSAYQAADMNALCEEALNFAYHSMRAKYPGFSSEVEKELSAGLKPVFVIQQDIMRVMLNVCNNAFYAVKEKAEKEMALKRKDYKPKVSVTTLMLNNRVTIKIKDNGPGISKEIFDKIFQPFFTTKPSGEGTGLGLSLSYDIITKGHSGEIKVYSYEGDGAEFVIMLPA